MRSGRSRRGPAGTSRRGSRDSRWRPRPRTSLGCSSLQQEQSVCFDRTETESSYHVVAKIFVKNKQTNHHKEKKEKDVVVSQVCDIIGQRK